MKKTAPYMTKVCPLLAGIVNVVRCSSTAGLGGCCNYEAALLYVLEEFEYFGLRDEDNVSLTCCMCRWNTL